MTNRPAMTGGSEAIDWAAVREGDRDVTRDERIALAAPPNETCGANHPRAGWMCTRASHSDDDIHVAGNGWEVCAVWGAGAGTLGAVLRVLEDRARAALAARNEATAAEAFERSERASIARHHAAARRAEALEALAAVRALAGEIETKGAPKP